MDKPHKMFKCQKKWFYYLKPHRDLTESAAEVWPKNRQKARSDSGRRKQNNCPPPTLLEGTTGKVRNRIGVNSNHLNFPNFPTSSITSKKQTPKTTTISEHYNTTWDWLWLNPAPLPPIIPQWNTNTVTFSPSENEPHRNSIEGTASSGWQNLFT